MVKQLDKFGKLFVFSIVAVLSIGMTLFQFVVHHDYIMITLYDILQSIINSGLIDPVFLAPADEYFVVLYEAIGLTDYIFLAIFIGFVIEMFVNAYNTKRESYSSIMGFLGYGILILLFISSVVESITGYLHDIFFNAILQNLPMNLYFFNFYIDNFAIINLIIIVLCVIINFIDFNNAEFYGRKRKEVMQQGDEI